MQWQSMKTAPRDGSEVLLVVENRAGIPGKQLVGHYMPGGHCIEDHPAIDEGWYFWNGCMFDKASKPLAWMPLPEFAGLPAQPCVGCRGRGGWEDGDEGQWVTCLMCDSKALIA